MKGKAAVYRPVSLGRMRRWKKSRKSLSLNAVMKFFTYEWIGHLPRISVDQPPRSDDGGGARNTRALH